MSGDYFTCRFINESIFSQIITGTLRNDTFYHMMNRNSGALCDGKAQLCLNKQCSVFQDQLCLGHEDSKYFACRGTLILSYLTLISWRDQKRRPA
jgi:hypothetical protein